MIPPITVEPGRIHYTADALWSRTRDLASAATAIRQAAAGLGRATWVGDDPERLVVEAELVSFARRIDEIRFDLEGVLATLEPDEWARSIDGGILLSRDPLRWLTGSLWAMFRPLTSFIESSAPWFPATSDVPKIERAAIIGMVTAPTTIADRLDRIPAGDTHIRIDRFDDATGPRFEVYLAGTDFTAGPENPWWAGANVDMLATGSSPAVRAVETAMRDAGVTESTPLVLTGHSQGGAIALALAASHRYTIDAVITAGTPVGLTGDAPNVPTLHVVHPEDPVPALGGRVADTTGTTVIVHPDPRRFGVDAHFAEVYRGSARRADDLHDPAITHFEERLPRGGTGIAEWFVAVNATR